MKAEFSVTRADLNNYPSELIEGCRRGDQKSQLQIYKLYYRPVYAICLKISGNPAIAESLMHESFLDAFENIGSFPADTDFIPWILKFVKYN